VRLSQKIIGFAAEALYKERESGTDTQPPLIHLLRYRQFVRERRSNQIPYYEISVKAIS
jgi:hypothetical protein